MAATWGGHPAVEEGFSSTANTGPGSSYPPSFEHSAPLSDRATSNLQCVRRSPLLSTIVDARASVEYRRKPFFSVERQIPM